MTIVDWIALGIIFFLLFCAVRYMIVSRKKCGCGGCCADCRGCGTAGIKCKKNPHKNGE